LLFFIAENEKEKVMNKINFLQSVPAFSKLMGRTISTLIYHFVTKQFFKDAVVYKEGEDPKMVYIIKNGEFKVIIDFAFFFIFSISFGFL